VILQFLDSTHFEVWMLSSTVWGISPAAIRFAFFLSAIHFSSSVLALEHGAVVKVLSVTHLA